MPTSLPTDNPVLVSALATGVFPMAAVIFERLRIPGIIGLIAFGTLMGPNGPSLLAAGGLHDGFSLGERPEEVA